jgi:hypothetical protein
MATFIKAGFWEKLCKPCKGYKGWLNLDEFVQSFIPKPTYKVFTALLTQSGGSENGYVFSGDLTIGITYFIDVITNDSDFTNVGAPNNNYGTYFVATGTTPNNWGDGALRYDTGAPVATVLENTIGNIWFTYTDFGSYSVESESLFTDAKTWVNPVIVLGDAGFPSRGVNTSGVMYLNAETTIGIRTDLDAYLQFNGILNNTPIEIRVYT